MKLKLEKLTYLCGSVEQKKLMNKELRFWRGP